MSAGPVIGERVHAEFFQALTDTDERAAIEIALALTESGLPVPEVLTGLIAPAQRQVGELWAADRWNVAQEHAATHICDRVVGALGLRVTVPRPPRGRVVLACVDGDWHALPARIVGETLRTEGWEVTFLGASTPAEHLARFIHSVGPDAVALSCSIATSLPKARSMIEATRQTGVPVLAGGSGFGPEGRWALRLGADAWAPDAAGAAARLAGGDWPAFTTPAPALDHLPDQDHARVALCRTTLVDRAMARLIGTRQDPAAGADSTPRRRPAGGNGAERVTAGYSERQFEATREDLGHIVDFLVAALLVDDVSLIESFTGWLVRILQVRGVPERAVAAGYEALARELTGFPRAARFMRSGRALLGGIGGTGIAGAAAG